MPKPLPFGMFRRIFIYLLVAPFYNTGIVAQPRTYSTSNFNKLNDTMWRWIHVRPDSNGLQAYVDSIARQGNLETTEYAHYFLVSSYCYEHRFSPTDTDCFPALANLVATFKTPALKALYKFQLGDHYCNKQDNTRGLDLMLEALSECKALGYQNVPLIEVMFYLLSNRYYYFNSYRNCIYYAAFSDKYTPPDSKNIGGLNTWGLAYQKLGLYDSAALKFREMMALAKLRRVAVWVHIAAGNLGRNYCLQRKFEQGLPLLYTDVVGGSKTEPDNSAISALYMAEAFLQMNRPDSALHYINLSKTIFTGKFVWGSSYFEHSKYGYYYFVQLSDWYKLSGRYADALHYKDSAVLYEKVYNSQFDWQVLSSTEKRIEGIEYQQNLALLASQQRAERLQKILLLISLVSLAIIGGLVFNRQRLKHQKEAQLARQKEANMLLQQRQAQQELETARQQLDDLLKSFEEKKQYQENITAGLLSISENDNPQQAIPQQVSRKLLELANTTLLTASDWQLFQQRFEKVYPNFFAELGITVPGISPAEERLLALLKLKISSRQMASMLAITPESVRKAKYRLRKKLASAGQPNLLLLLDEQEIAA